jgi:acetyltransferase
MPDAPRDALGAHAGPWTLEDGTSVHIRPLDADDEPRMVAFHQRLSDRSVYYRYLNLYGVDERVRHGALSSASPIDPALELVLAAVRNGEIIGIGGMARVGRGSAEMALLIADAHQGKGLGEELLRRLVQVARSLGIASVAGEMLAENEPMIRVARRAGFQIAPVAGDPRMVRAELKLRAG